ncbi:hypothetical protein ABZ249_18360 [Nocardiopsis sp. NPDC006139]|uniref:hypothetical protein n=1 Tax=Nocardiopsis TaxID=2013 RepID=UPI00159B16EB|nr:hypothetical protein HUT17_03320 [Nocardiopsis flavescens]
MSRTSPGRRRAPRGEGGRRREGILRIAGGAVAAHGRDRASSAGARGRAGLTRAGIHSFGPGPLPAVTDPRAAVRAPRRPACAGPSTGEGER